MNYDDRLKEVQSQTKGMTDGERIELMLKEIDKQFPDISNLASEASVKRNFAFKDNWKGILSIILIVGIIFVAGGILI